MWPLGIAPHRGDTGRVSLAAEGDFRDFVAVRWPDLEAVALLVTLDGDTARLVTTESLQRVHRGWREAVDDGRPGELAQRDVLTAAVAAARAAASESPSGAPASSAADDHARYDDEGAAPGDLVTDALVDALRAAAPLERAVLAARTVWGLEPDEVAGLLGMPSARVRDAATGLRAGLARAHAAARSAQGLGPADWAVERDLDEAIAAVLAGQHDPPDPVALVEDLRRSTRRRSVVVAGVVLAAAGAASWWAVTGRDSAPVSSGSPPRRSPDPTDPRWNTVAAWPPRGSLAKDVGILAMVAEQTSRRGRLLWAGDALGQRIVVASKYGQPYPPGPMLVAWRAPTGASPTALWEEAGPVLEEDAWIRDERDGLAVVLSTGVAEHMRALAVLARPTVTSATYSRMVRPTRAGTVVRLWETLRLAGGVGAVRLPGYVGPAARVRWGGYDGPVLGVRREATLPPSVDGRTGPESLHGRDAVVRGWRDGPPRRDPGVVGGRPLGGRGGRDRATRHPGSSSRRPGDGRPDHDGAWCRRAVGAGHGRRPQRCGLARPRARGRAAGAEPRRTNPWCCGCRRTEIPASAGSSSSRRGPRGCSSSGPCGPTPTRRRPPRATAWPSSTSGTPVRPRPTASYATTRQVASSGPASLPVARTCSTSHRSERTFTGRGSGVRLTG